MRSSPPAFPSPHSTTTSTPAHHLRPSARRSALAQTLPAHRPSPAVSQTTPTAPSAHVNATVSPALVTGSSLTAVAPAAATATRTPAAPPPMTMRSHPLPAAKASSSADRQPLLRLVANSHAFPCTLIRKERAAWQGTFSTPRTSGPRCSSPKHSFKEKSALDRSESLIRRQSRPLTPITKPNPRQHSSLLRYQVHAPASCQWGWRAQHEGKGAKCTEWHAPLTKESACVDNRGHGARGRARSPILQVTDAGCKSYYSILAKGRRAEYSATCLSKSVYQTSYSLNFL